jgi:hypothetical protein
MSDTPRTDAVFPLGRSADFSVPHDAVELAGLARQLERENAALRRHAEAMAFLIEDGTNDSVWLAAVKAYRAEFPKVGP